MFGNERGELLIIGHRGHEPGDEANERKQLPEKTSKKASQAKQGKNAEENQIHPVHCRKPFRNMRMSWPKLVAAVPTTDYLGLSIMRLQKLSSNQQSKQRRTISGRSLSSLEKSFGQLVDPFAVAPTGDFGHDQLHYLTEVLDALGARFGNAGLN